LSDFLLVRTGLVDIAWLRFKNAAHTDGGKVMLNGSLNLKARTSTKQKKLRANAPRPLHIGLHVLYA